MNRVLVWRHKHGQNLYDASTPEALRAACRLILTEYRNDGWIWEPDAEPERPEILDLSDEEIDQLPDVVRQSTHDQKTEARRKYEDRYSAWREEANEWILLNDFLNNDNPRIDPWRDILSPRNGAEYEEFEFDSVWTAEDV